MLHAMFTAYLSIIFYDAFKDALCDILNDVRLNSGVDGGDDNRHLSIVEACQSVEVDGPGEVDVTGSHRNLKCQRNFVQQKPKRKFEGIKAKKKVFKMLNNFTQ
jgi:hypothetical protein